MKYLSLIKQLTNAKGAPGFEDEVIEVIKANKGDYSLHVDNMKNAYLNLNQYDSNRPTVMIDSHMDEVGFMVRAIDDNGLLVIQELGGWLPSNVSSQQFLVRNQDGDYHLGICTTKPIHFMSQEERQKPVKMADLKIDVGATSREEVINDYGITIGQPIVPSTQFSYNEKNGTMLAKAFDNRIGVSVAVAVMSELAEVAKDLPFNLVASFATQEEVGLRGAKVTSNRINPTIAIVLEGTPADDFTGSETMLQAQMGQGPQLRHRDSSYIANVAMIDLMDSVAVKEKIQIQHAVRDGGGTNAGAIHLANLGVPVAVLGVPSRYVHTNASFASYKDFEATVALVKAFILDLTPEKLAEFQLKEY